VEYGVPAVIARLAQTFGPGVPVSDNRVFMQFTKSALKHENIVLHTKGDSMSNYCYITDALAGILALMKAGEAGEAYNVCHDEETRSIASIAQLVATHVSNNKSKVVFDIPEDVQGFGYAPTVHMFLSSKKLKSLGWKPKVSMAQAYVRLAEYIQEEGL
jgi:NAD-dependent epimerase/dehydratase family protein